MGARLSGLALAASALPHATGLLAMHSCMAPLSALSAALLAGDMMAQNFPPGFGRVRLCCRMPLLGPADWLPNDTVTSERMWRRLLMSRARHAHIRLHAPVQAACGQAGYECLEVARTPKSLCSMSTKQLLARHLSSLHLKAVGTELTNTLSASKSLWVPVQAPCGSARPQTHMMQTATSARRLTGSMSQMSA